MNINTIPKSYEEWHHCVTVICQQELTLPYIERRIKALSSTSDYMTKRFVQLYGEQQHIKTIEWFEKAQTEL